MKSFASGSVRVTYVVAVATLLACSAGSDGTPGAANTPDGGSPPATLDGGTNTADGAVVPGSDAATEVPYAGGDITVSIVGAPATVTGTVTVHVEAASAAAIAKIEPLIDDKPIGSLSAAPYDLQWNSALVSNGAHTLSAKAYDLAGKTGTAKSVAITTSNFLLAGTWMWSNITDAHTGFSTDSCDSKSFTVTFDAQSSTVTFPSISVKCYAQNNAPYTSSVEGFSKVVDSADYDKPLTNTSGYKTINFSTTTLTRIEMPFPPSSYTLSGSVTRQ